MKVIDEKGRLFNRINIVDLVVLIVLILFVGIIGYKLVGSKLGNNKANAKSNDIVFNIRCTVRSEGIAKSVQPKQQLISLVKYVDAYVEAVEYSDADIWVTTSDGRVVIAKDPEKKDMLIKIKMKANTDSDDIKLGSQNVAIGKTFTFKTRKVELGGIVESIES
jgi:hypothetical protein